MKELLKKNKIDLNTYAFIDLCDQIFIEKYMNKNLPEYLTFEQIEKMEEFYNDAMFRAYGNLEKEHIKIYGGSLIGFIVDVFKSRIKGEPQNIYENSEKLPVPKTAKLFLLSSVICLYQS